MSKLKKLSICIPTYNRPNCLRELLLSIADEGIEEIEVVVCDDASPEDPTKIIHEFKSSIPDLKYIRHPSNIGLDRNFLSVVHHASGEYVWLIGDDDVIEPGGIGRVLGALESKPKVTGLTLGVVDYDAEMKNLVGIRNTPDSQYFSTAAEVFSEVSSLLGFMSALVVDRAAWAEVIARDPIEEYQNYYVQVYILGRALLAHGGWRIVNEPCVRFRTDNDQLTSKFGWFRRLSFDVEAYGKLANGLFPADVSTRRSIRQATLKVHVVAKILNLKTRSEENVNVLSTALYLGRNYWDLPGYWAVALPLLLTPRLFVRLLRHAYQKFSWRSGTARARQFESNG